MEIVTDSQGKRYSKVGETCFHPDTPEELQILLNDLIENRRETRVRVILGDSKTGRDWGEENDVVGYLGRSTGTVKIPLLIHNKRSSGGPALSDDCILQIRINGGRILWTHPNYKPSHYSVRTFPPEPYSDGKVYTAMVQKDGEEHALCETKEQAERLAAFMRGERGAK